MQQISEEDGSQEKLNGDDGNSKAITTKSVDAIKESDELVDLKQLKMVDDDKVDVIPSLEGVDVDTNAQAVESENTSVEASEDNIEKSAQEEISDPLIENPVVSEDVDIKATIDKEVVESDTGKIIESVSISPEEFDQHIDESIPETNATEENLDNITKDSIVECRTSAEDDKITKDVESSDLSNLKMDVPSEIEDSVQCEQMTSIENLNEKELTKPNDIQLEEDIDTVMSIDDSQMSEVPMLESTAITDDSMLTENNFQGYESNTLQRNETDDTVYSSEYQENSISYLDLQSDNSNSEINFSFLQNEINKNIKDKSKLKVNLDNDMKPLSAIPKAPRKSLPKCRMTRTYICDYCNLSTQSPRDHLYHLRDYHKEPINVYECDSCQYASKNFTKLMRHLHMVHKTYIKGEVEENGVRIKVKPSRFLAPLVGSDNLMDSQSFIDIPKEEPSNTTSPKLIEEEPFNDQLDYEVDEEEESMLVSAAIIGKKVDKIIKCEQCDYTTKSRKHMTKHEMSTHLKKTFYRCSKCNYVTHLKGRYAKHLKYHDLPIVKCEFCDFRTPYRWNLDRHLRNHTDEGAGEYKCHKCNFSASIKQSLTVHIANHHLTPEQIKERELKRTIGISDPSDYIGEEDELEMLKMERDEHPDAFQLADNIPNQSFTVSNIDVDDSNKLVEDTGDSTDGADSKKKKIKIKMTLKKMKSTKDQTSVQELNERHNFGDDFIHPDDIVHKNGNVYIKNRKCDLCSFKAAFKSELEKHVIKSHPEHAETFKKSKKSSKNASPSNIELNRSQSDDTSQLTESSYQNSPDSFSQEESNKYDDFSEESSDKPSNANPHNLVCQYCGHNSKNLSESIRHQKLHSSVKNNNSSGTSVLPSCQFCKMNFKTSRELAMHLKNCSELKNNNFQEEGSSSGKELGDDSDSESKSSYQIDNESRSVSRASSESEAQEKTDEKSDKIKSSGKEGHTYSKRVYKCPQCMFWSTTASRFHVHIVGHFNKKPFVCSVCAYKSNWRWDITKHIKIWMTKDDSHKDATVLITDDYPTKNYEKYEQYITVIQLKDGESKSEGPVGVRKIKQKTPVDDTGSPKSDGTKKQCTSSSDNSPTVSTISSMPPMVRIPIDNGIVTDTSVLPAPPKLTRAPNIPQTNSDFNGSVSVPFNLKEFLIKNNITDVNANQSNKNGNPQTSISNFMNYSEPVTVKKPPPLLALKELTSMQSSSVNRKEFTPPPPYSSHHNVGNKNSKAMTSAPSTLLPSGGQYQLITPQVSASYLPQGQSVSTSLETLQLLASGSPNVLANLQSIAAKAAAAAAHAKSQDVSKTSPLSSQSSNTPSSSELKAANDEAKVTNNDKLSAGLANLKNVLPQSVYANLVSEASNPQNLNNPASKLALQMRVLLWMNLLNREAKNKQLVQANERQEPNQQEGKFLEPNPPQQLQRISTDPAIDSPASDPNESPAPELVFDHQGQPEWKCALCNFRDADRSTLDKHNSLVHARSSAVVSMMHAVHRCDVCAFAAGTKRHVQLHIATAHGGMGGITSSCEGQNPNAGSGKLLSCKVCPFQSTKRSIFKQHLANHNPKPDCLYSACVACPYYVTDKKELLEHLTHHGLKIPGVTTDSNNSSQQKPALEVSVNNSPMLQCDACPYVAVSRAKLLNHRQFHRPRDLAFKCPQCTYNATRRHLLAQHIRVHNLPPETIEQLYGSNGVTVDEGRSRGTSPSPSLTITPINGSTAQTGLQIKTGIDSPVNITPKTEIPAIPNEEFLPTLSDTDTMKLEDIPLVWISRNGVFLKMFKCRWCPHNNVRKSNVVEHEKMHQVKDTANIPGSVKCSMCSYVGFNVAVMAAHIKVHDGTLCKIYGFVDSTKSDEEQIQALFSVAAINKITSEQTQPIEEKVIFCCQLCPTRFFEQKEIIRHIYFHNTKSGFACDKCSYSARTEAQFIVHSNVHKPDYHEQTRTFLTQFKPSKDYPPVMGITVPSEQSNSISAVPKKAKETLVKDGQTRFKCSLCPSTFSKQITLQYHQSLHGANNPYKCDKCNYTTKTQDALAQHTALHIRHEKDKKEEEQKMTKETNDQPPIRLKVSGLNSQSLTSHTSVEPIKESDSSKSVTAPSTDQFKYYMDEHIPLSGVDLLRHKTQIEKDQVTKPSKDVTESTADLPIPTKSKGRASKNEEDDAKRIGNPELNYPLHVDKSSGKAREKRFKCRFCPSAFEKVDQYNVHANLHGANYKYKCRICDYSVKFFANFSMHINRHKYNEAMDAKKKGSPALSDTDIRYEPLINDTPDTANKNHEKDNSNSATKDIDIANIESCEDLTTAEKQHILLQNKKGIDNKKEEERDKKVYYCQYCPYANVRRDAVDSHSQRHISNGGRGLYKCNFCDYIASQPNFLKEHTKVHFKPFKHVSPEGYIKHDQEEIFSSELFNEDRPEPRDCSKKTIFSHTGRNFFPTYKTTLNSPPVMATEEDKETKPEDDKENDTLIIDPHKENGIAIDFFSCEVVRAPPNNILIIKPSKKSKEVHLCLDSDYNGEYSSHSTKTSDNESDSNHTSSNSEVRTSKRRRSEKFLDVTESRNKRSKHYTSSLLEKDHYHGQPTNAEQLYRTIVESAKKEVAKQFLKTDKHVETTQSLPPMETESVSG